MSWTHVAAYAEIENEETLPIEVDGHAICLYNLEGEIFATDNRCTHGDAALSDGLIQEGGLIECPLHEGTFDIRTGKAKSAPCTKDVRCHEIKVENGIIYLRPAAR